LEFASLASTSAVCSFCRSSLVREGEQLRRIGESAELFDDHSPLQLGVRGSRQGVGFTLVGRLQMATKAAPGTSGTHCWSNRVPNSTNKTSRANRHPAQPG